jgi:4-oxalocrotonate tautomerase
MPHILIKLAIGKTEEEKGELTRRIVQDVISVLHVGEDAVSIAIEEIESQHWKEQVYQPDIQARWSTLYKQPGYKP